MQKNENMEVYYGRRKNRKTKSTGNHRQAGGRIEMVKYFCNIHTEKIIDWNISFQTVSCIHLMNVDVYDCNSHIHNPTCFHLTLDLFQTDSVV